MLVQLQIGYEKVSSVSLRSRESGGLMKLRLDSGLWSLESGGSSESYSVRIFGFILLLLLWGAVILDWHYYY